MQSPDIKQAFAAFAGRSTLFLVLIDMPHLRKLVLEHYEQVDPETRRLVPLTKLYWPVDQGA